MNIMLIEKYDDYNEECPKKDNVNKKRNVNVNIYKINKSNNNKIMYKSPNILSIEKNIKNKSKKGICNNDCII